jgi:Domain of unknown function (DUF4111)
VRGGTRPYHREVSLDEVRAYDGELVARVRDVLESELVGVYVSGSVALGDYVPGRSDLDRFAVVEAPLPPNLKDAVVAAARHEALPCPARGLELVVYSRGAVAVPASGGAFELNLDTGPGMALHLAFDPADEPAHWFVVDRAIARDHARPLVGPPPGETFAPIPRPDLLAALAAALRWHDENREVAGENTVLNACRAWRYAVEGTWSSKAEAARWARQRLADPSVVDATLARRLGAPGDAVDGAAAAALVDRVRSSLT